MNINFSSGRQKLEIFQLIFTVTLLYLIQQTVSEYVMKLSKSVFFLFLQNNQVLQHANSYSHAKVK